jgi:hypothetical protein
MEPVRRQTGRSLRREYFKKSNGFNAALTLIRQAWCCGTGRSPDDRKEQVALAHGPVFAPACGSRRAFELLFLKYSRRRRRRFHARSGADAAKALPPSGASMAPAAAFCAMTFL